MTGYENDMEKDVTLAIQQELADVLIIKRDIQTINQKSELDNLLYGIYKKMLVKLLKNLFLKLG